MPRNHGTGPPGPPPDPPPPPPPGPPPGPGREALLPVAEVAKLWRCSKDKIYALIAAGELRVVDIGEGRAKTRVPESAMREYIQRKGRRATRGRAA